jgi:hypothetical protein
MKVLDIVIFVVAVVNKDYRAQHEIRRRVSDNSSWGRDRILICILRKIGHTKAVEVIRPRNYSLVVQA